MVEYGVVVVGEAAPGGIVKSQFVV